MIFANHWVAKKIHSYLPTSSVLRRHPPPSQTRFSHLKSCAGVRGFNISTATNRELAKSLDAAVDPLDPQVNKVGPSFLSQHSTFVFKISLLNQILFFFALLHYRHNYGEGNFNFFNGAHFFMAPSIFLYVCTYKILVFLFFHLSLSLSLQILRNLATQAMSQAEYFSTGSVSPYHSTGSSFHSTTSPDHFSHYGLALDYYTHFTSPIRRYADIIVSSFINPLATSED